MRGEKTVRKTKCRQQTMPENEHTIGKRHVLTRVIAKSHEWNTQVPIHAEIANEILMPVQYWKTCKHVCSQMGCAKVNRHSTCPQKHVVSETSGTDIAATNWLSHSQIKATLTWPRRRQTQSMSILRSGRYIRHRGLPGDGFLREKIRMEGPNQQTRP